MGLAWKCLFTPPKLFLGAFTPKSGITVIYTPKAFPWTPKLHQIQLIPGHDSGSLKHSPDALAGGEEARYPYSPRNPLVFSALWALLERVPLSIRCHSNHCCQGHTMSQWTYMYFSHQFVMCLNELWNVYLSQWNTVDNQPWNWR